jgi:ABC-type spermidine/putrescine transport system permease subunit II
MRTAARRVVRSADRSVRPRARFRRREALVRSLCAASGYLMVVLIYAPIVWLAVMSVSDDPLSGLPRRLTSEHYDRLFSDVRWVGPLQLSLALALGVGLGCMLMATLVGRALPRARARGSALLGALLPLFLPGVVLGTALFLYLRSFLGLKLGLWSLAIVHFVWAFPFALLAVLVMASRFDARLLDAAADLGATRWQRFWHIEYPALRPAIIAAGLFGFLLSFNELPRSIFLRGRETTLPLYIWAQASSHTSNVPLIYALSTLVLLVSLAVITSAFWLLFARGEGDSEQTRG